MDPAATAKCARNLGAFGLNVVRCSCAEEAIEGAQILTTCTADKQNATILTDNMVGAGVHINAIGGDCPGKTELAAGILHRSDVFVEFPPQTRIEGEIQQMTRGSCRHRALGSDQRSAKGTHATTSRSLCSTASVLQSRISAPCVTSATTSKAPNSLLILIC